MTSKAMEHMTAPRYCACLKNMEPSRWHCGCGRWKPSGVDQCERCAAGLVDTDLNPARALMEYFAEATA